MQKNFAESSGRRGNKMGCQADVVLGANLTFSVCTHDPDTGVLTDADAVPSYRVYEDETATPILSGNMAKLDDANTTGFYTEQIACTALNGFEVDKSYTVYIQATVDGDTGGICYGFTVTPDLPTAAEVKTAIEASGSYLQLLSTALVNKLIVTKATGNTEMFNDAGTSLGSVATAFTEDVTTTTRLRMVI